MGVNLPALAIQGVNLPAIDQAIAQNKLVQYQMQDAQAKAEQRNRLAAMIQGLPEEQRVAASLDPEAFARAQAARLFPDPAKRYQISDGTVFDLGGPEGPKVALQGPRKAPEGMQYNEAGRLVPIPGYVEMQSRIAAARRDAPVTWGTWTDPATGRTYQRSSRGQLAELPGAGSEPMVEVYDPASPTGTKYVPRSQAAGQSGPPPSGMRLESDGKGGFVMVQGRGAGSGSGVPTVEQGRAGGFANRMVEAERRIEALPPNFSPIAMSELRARLPVVGNVLASRDYQLYRQAAEDWIRAKLRKESGAVIGADEMEAEFRNYFPQPGDAPEVVQQKAAARRTALQSMIGESGPGYNAVRQVQPPATAPAQSPTPPPAAQPQPPGAQRPPDAMSDDEILRTLGIR